MVKIPQQIEWLEPWEPVKGEGEELVLELKKELSRQHVLYGVQVVAVARRIDCDDVLFATGDSSMPLAVVHLTWRGRTERDPQWPRTTIYPSWEDWIEGGLGADHREYWGDGGKVH